LLWWLKLPAAISATTAPINDNPPAMRTPPRMYGIAAGSAGAGSGLAYRIAESAYRLNIPRMFAALLLLSVAGVAIFFALSWISHLLLRRWHESALANES
jgi:NitT/TauT family transport system permease protein